MPPSEFSAPVPVFRSFDEAKAREFYLDFLEFKIEFEHRFGPDAPLYLGLEKDGCKIHLSEHHGDGAPGANIRIEATNLKDYTARLREKSYKYANPGDPVEKLWGLFEVTLVDPFGNRLTFVEPA